MYHIYSVAFSSLFQCFTLHTFCRQIIFFRIFYFCTLYHSPSPDYALFLTACPVTPPSFLLCPPHCCSIPQLLKLFLCPVFPFSCHCFMSLSPLSSRIVSTCAVLLCLPADATESRENSFSRSRSSSVSSIDRDTKEAITTLQFGESYARKSDLVPTPCLWVGTSLGVVLLIPMSIPTDQEERMEEPVTIGPSGKSQ